MLGTFIDVEEESCHTFAPRACRVVCEGLKKEGFTPGVYASLSWWNNYLTEIKEYTCWVAHWNPTCGYAGNYQIWQYGTEHIDGSNGEVDANYYYGDFGKTTTISKSVPDIIYQVYTDTSGWLPTVRNLEDYAGVDGQAIKGIRVFANSIKHSYFYYLFLLLLFPRF